MLKNCSNKYAYYYRTVGSVGHGKHVVGQGQIDWPGLEESPEDPDSSISVSRSQVTSVKRKAVRDCVSRGYVPSPDGLCESTYHTMSYSVPSILNPALPHLSQVYA